MSESDVNASGIPSLGKLFTRHHPEDRSEGTTMDNLIVWADIPVTDLDRAMKFYGAVLERPFITMEGLEGVALPSPDEGEDPSGQDLPVAFDLVQSEGQTPSLEGCTIYLEAGGDAQGMLQRAADAGGQILSPAAFMGEMVGTIGFFQDSEGNRIGVHQQGGGS
jgi:predicted enzyme related to lactoylglutathione lyase